jgi:hypothetical protein
LSDAWVQAVGDLSEEHLVALVEILSTATSEEAFAAALRAKPDLLAALDDNFMNAAERPVEFRADLARADGALRRYQDTGVPDHLDEALHVYARICGHPSFDSQPEPFRLSVLANRASNHLDRYVAFGAVEDLEVGMRLADEEVVRRTPEESPRLPGRLNNRAVALINRYELLGADRFDERLTRARRR